MLQLDDMIGLISIFPTVSHAWVMSLIYMYAAVSMIKMAVCI